MGSIIASTLKDFEALPPDAKRQVVDFIEFIKSRYQGTSPSREVDFSESAGFGRIKVTKAVTLEDMEVAIREKGGEL